LFFPQEYSHGVLQFVLLVRKNATYPFLEEALLAVLVPVEAVIGLKAERSGGRCSPLGKGVGEIEGVGEIKSFLEKSFHLLQEYFFALLLRGNERRMCSGA
jgi:hypothetical protein